MATNTGKSTRTSSSKMKRFELDRQAVAKLFSKIKENEKIDENVKLKVDRVPRDIQKINAKDFSEQMLYYRSKCGYSQRQVGQAVGISEDMYRRYELKEYEITNINLINKIVEFLKFEEQPKISEYAMFLSSNPVKILDNFLKGNGLSKRKFSELSGISRRAMLDWYNGKKTISKDSYYRIKTFMKEFENEKLYKEQVMEEEDEME